MQTLISIITPVYNAEKYIEQAVRSVLDQTYTHWELLLVNDGSTDCSKEIISSFFDNRIRYAEQTNKGVSAARNVGLANMKGDYFCFLDADDALPPDSLQSRLEVFYSNPDTHFVDGRVEYLDSTFTSELKSWAPDFQGNPLYDLLLLSGKSFFGPTWMIKRQPGADYSFKEGLTHGEELLFYINLARGGGVYRYTNKTVLHYRTGHTSAMTNLQGLEAGYRCIYDELKHLDDIPTAWRRNFYRKMRSILVKSYLRRGEFFNALSAFLR